MLDEFFSYDINSFTLLNDIACRVDDVVTKVDLPGIPKGSKFDYVVVDFDTCICTLASDVRRLEVTLYIKFIFEAQCEICKET
jgi:hypothetical protein